MYSLYGKIFSVLLEKMSENEEPDGIADTSALTQQDSTSREGLAAPSRSSVEFARAEAVTSITGSNMIMNLGFEIL